VPLFEAVTDGVSDLGFAEAVGQVSSDDDVVADGAPEGLTDYRPFDRAPLRR
jgi:hypothetical protein